MNSLAIAIPPIDVELLQQAAAGDERAFSALYELYATPVYNYLVRLLNEPTVAEEIVQDVFLAMWQSAPGFRAQSSVKTWLLRIAHHQAVSWLRRHHRETLLDDATEIGHIDLVEEALVQRWQVDQVRTALSQLSIKHRAVIELTFVHGLSYTEIAEVLNCPIGTVKSRMSYALQHMSRLLDETAPNA